MTTTVNERELGVGSSLRDRVSFPTWGDCPHEADFDDRYYDRPTDGTIMASLKRHWCFLGEIVKVVSKEKLVLDVRDMAGRTVRLECFSEDGGRAHLAKGLVKPGNTIAVFYALQHQFPGGYLGLGPEENDDIVILPHSLHNLQAANRALWGFHGAACAAEDCEKTEDLMICSSCRLVRYCSPEHSKADWENHKGLCKAGSALSLFTERDWTKFENNKYWRFPV